jgi:hypothetical protein
VPLTRANREDGSEEKSSRQLDGMPSGADADLVRTE